LAARRESDPDFYFVSQRPTNVPRWKLVIGGLAVPTSLLGIHRCSIYREWKGISEYWSL